MTADDVGGIALFLFVVAVWLLPILIASIRKHTQLTPIILITLLAGWTVIGWFIALVWSAASFQKQEAVR